jgi:hypothetical protein
VLDKWRELVISGLVARSGDAYQIRIGAPLNLDGTFSCRLVIPGIADSAIHGENALSTLISALKIVERQVYEPSALLIAETTLTKDDYPDLSISVRVDP